MKHHLFLTIGICLSTLAFAQNIDSTSNHYANAADLLLRSDSKLMIGGYGEVHYNQPINGDTYNNGNLDVHRMVMLFGYSFNNKTQFVTEIEYEHVKEVYVEQAFLQYKLNKSINLRGGLMLVPMGIINEVHEPTTFHGVERPLIDGTIAPTTWREIGVGLSGDIFPASLKYQAYMLNGFNGFDGAAHLSGKDGLRKGRQKGAESFMSAPNYSARVAYYGIRGLNVGISAYFGKTQSTLYHKLSKNDAAGIASADSSVVKISMLGIDARYNLHGFRLKGQYYYTSLTNTLAYNIFTASADGNPNDLGSAMTGYYAEISYNVLRYLPTKMHLEPFFRYEFLNTHHRVESQIERNMDYKKTGITSGLTLTLDKGVVVKTDLQLIKSASDNTYAKSINVGFGILF